MAFAILFMSLLVFKKAAIDRGDMRRHIEPLCNIRNANHLADGLDTEEIVVDALKPNQQRYNQPPVFLQERDVRLRFFNLDSGPVED